MDTPSRCGGPLLFFDVVTVVHARTAGDYIAVVQSDSVVTGQALIALE